MKSIRVLSDRRADSIVQRTKPLHVEHVLCDVPENTGKGLVLIVTKELIELYTGAQIYTCQSQ